MVYFKSCFKKANCINEQRRLCLAIAFLLFVFCVCVFNFPITFLDTSFTLVCVLAILIHGTGRRLFLLIKQQEAVHFRWC